MHIDLHDPAGAPALLEGDVAVIGAGAAGITMSRRLLDQGLRVVLLESGGTDYGGDTAALNAGDVVGQPYYELEHSRLRFFGGTTAIWGGRCAELDPIDFAYRPWVGHSGWPSGPDELHPYYAEARRALDLPDFSPSDLADMLLPLGAEELRQRIWTFDEVHDRFAIDRSADVVDHPHCTVVTHATVREILAGAEGRTVVGLDVRGLNDRRLTVRARRYVLAAGGLENPRLLLASRSVVPVGLGNEHDLVGRFFMEHPHARGGRIVNGAVWRLLSAFGGRRLRGRRLAALITPSADLQRREGILNSSLTIVARRPARGREALLMRAYHHIRHNADPTRVGRTAWRMAKRIVGEIQRVTDPLRPWALHKLGKLEVTLLVRAEQAPNPESRVRLTGERDAIGMPRIALDWRTSDIDIRSIDRLVEALGRECRRLGLGDVETAAWLKERGAGWMTDPLVSSHPIGGYHHMGTTRMATDKRHGVTDRNGRLHGVDNLYIAGSSLFPTSGWANPTLTIIALAMRTADVIADELAVSATHMMVAE